MALTATKIAFYLTLIVFFFGQLLRFQLFSVSFPALDLAILTLFITNIISLRTSKNLKIHNKPFLVFLVFTWLTYTTNLIRSNHLSLTSLFYLLRLNLLLSFFIFPLNKNIFTKKALGFLSLILISSIIFGLLQYFFWPDFTYFDSLQWDPHLYRLVGTFFDPTFTALIFLIFLIFIFLKKQTITPLVAFSYIGLALTYSRSSLLAFLLAFTYIALKTKKSRIFIISFIVFLITIFSLPRMPGEGTKLERTSSIIAKIENYKEAFTLIPKSPVLGIGYNNISYYRSNTEPNSHSKNAFDSSLINILVTTGIIGLSLFLLGLYTYFQKTDLTHQTILIALVFHSLFANSLFYPWCLILLFLI
ncbi:MAG: O-antigen ligase family protein [Patescibacteria group bacterium]|jgi:hypothetical protein